MNDDGSKIKFIFTNIYVSIDGGGRVQLLSIGDANNSSLWYIRYESDDINSDVNVRWYLRASSHLQYRVVTIYNRYVLNHVPVRFWTHTGSGIYR